MEWYAVLALILVIILAVILGILLACMLSGQGCTIAIQKRTPNQELTQIQLEQEQKRQKQFGTKFKNAFKSSSKSEQPVVPVEDVKTVEVTFKLGGEKKDSESVVAKPNESSVALLPDVHINQAQRDERQKKRDELRKKYKL